MIFIFGYIIIETELLKDGTTSVSYVMLKINKNQKWKIIAKYSEKYK